MKPNHRVTLLAFAVIVILGSVNVASACSCMEPPPPCEAFGYAKAVFVGKVVGAKEQKETTYDGVKEVYDVGEIYFKVEEAFFGVKSSRVVIHSGTGGGDCGYWFRRGESYLIYASGESADLLYTSICSRTRPLAGAEEDLAFLRNLPRRGSGVRIFGTVAAAVKDPTSADWRTAKPLSGITVKIEGKRRTFDATTDGEGKYEMTGLEAGKYKVRPVLPKFYNVNEYSLEEIEINDRGCVQKDFFAQNDSRIEGRIIQPDGSGLPKVSVELVPVEASGGASWYNNDQTYADEDGNYELREVAPGRYLLGINIGNSPDSEAPYPRTFYPGVTDRSQATVIEIGLGQKLNEINIALPLKLIERTVRGQVVWPDGSPAVNVDIHLEDVTSPGRCVNGCSVKTDSNGQFVLEGLEGYSYKVQAMSDAPQRYTDGPVIKIMGDIAGIKAILSFTGRPWDKDESPEEEEKKSP